MEDKDQGRADPRLLEQRYKDHRAYRVWHVWNPEQFGVA